jgi:hypothetical protein
MHVVIISISIPSGLLAYWQWTKWRQRRNHGYKLEEIEVPTEQSKASKKKNSFMDDMKKMRVSLPLQDLTLQGLRNMRLKDVKEALQLSIKSVWVALTEEHQLINIVYKHRANFPRGDRVLMVFAANLSQLYVTGLFQDSSVLQAQWACAPTSSGDLHWGGVSNSTGWCHSHCDPAGHNATSLLKLYKQECDELCECEKQDPELVFAIARAILAVLITGVPLSIMSGLFTKGHDELIAADELRMKSMLFQLCVALNDFEKQKVRFVTALADSMPASAQSFQQLIACIRAVTKILKDYETEGESESKKHPKYRLSKYGRYTWTVFLLDSLQSLDMNLKKGRHDWLVARVDYVLELPSIHPGLALAMQDCGECGETQDTAETHTIIQHRKARPGSKIKENRNAVTGSTFITLGYCIITAYILFTSWSILLFALQYGATDARLWLRAFGTSLLVDLLIMNPLNIAFNAVFYVPVVEYIVIPKFREFIASRRTKTKLKGAIRIFPIDNITADPSSPVERRDPEVVPATSYSTRSTRVVDLTECVPGKFGNSVRKFSRDLEAGGANETPNPDARRVPGPPTKKLRISNLTENPSVPSFIASFREYSDSDNESKEDTKGADISPNAAQVGGPPRKTHSPWRMEPKPSSIRESKLLLLETSNALHGPPRPRPRTSHVHEDYMASQDFNIVIG